MDIKHGNDSDSEHDYEAELQILIESTKKLESNTEQTSAVRAHIVDMINTSGGEVNSDTDDSDLIMELEHIKRNTENRENNEALPESNVPDNVSSDSTEKQTTVNISDVLKERFEMYKVAEQNANECKDFAKVKRLNRGINTIKKLLGQVNMGKTIDINDVPPEVPINISRLKDYTPDENKSEPQTAELSAKQDTDNQNNFSNELKQQMKSRQSEYKKAALECKRSGDTTRALTFLKVIKQFDIVIQMCEDGQDVDLSDMPPPPEEFDDFMQKLQGHEEQSPTKETESTSQDIVVEKEYNLLEDLRQRLDKYKSVEESSKLENNASKSRRLGRIVKQYEDAIKAHKKGAPFPYEELPIPAGFSPLPSDNKVQTKPSLPSAVSENSNISLGTASEIVDTTTINNSINNKRTEQFNVLLERQKEFKLAALKCKKEGNITKAKEYLKIYKGLAELLNAANSGLPVDLKSLPLSPLNTNDLEATFINSLDERSNVEEGLSDAYAHIEEQLRKQLMICKNARDNFNAVGDIAGKNRFENLALTVKKDLDYIKLLKSQSILPKFHSESREFDIVCCNGELEDNELEIVIIRGTFNNIPNSKTVDSYVKLEFPLPNDESYKAKTSTIKDTNSPNYEQSFKIQILRNNRQFLRIIKRHGVKLEVYSKGWFLLGDTFIGSANVKLQKLETHCDIHQIMDVTEGRKNVVGKLEVKIRVKMPLLKQDIQHSVENWLVLDTPK